MGKELTIKQHLSKYFKATNVIKNTLGDFLIGDQLGQGGTSIVREATLDGQEDFAIKFLHENIADKETTAYKRFKQAYINLLNIQNTGVVLPQIHIDTLQLNDEIIIPYVIMKKANTTLKEYHKNILNENKMSFEIFENLFNDLIHIVDTIHHHNIIHRDLKPENLFILENKLVLGDFDIAKFSDENHIKLVETKKGDRLANFAFSAPEQIKFEDITPSADWFAVGQILYWFVTGNTLRGQEEINLKQYDERYQRYELIIEKLLQQNPQDRFQNKADIISFIEQMDENLQGFERREKLFKTLRLFDGILEKYSIGKGHHQYQQITDKNVINELFQELSDNVKSLDLWWSQGLQDNHLSNIEKYKSISVIDRMMESIPFKINTKWVLGNFEIDIESIWIFKYREVGGSILIVESAILA